jgi:uncharacterized protein
MKSIGNSWAKPLLLLGGGFAIAYLTACLLLFWQQQRFIFVPSATVETTPAKYGIPFQDIWLPIKTSTGQTEQIHGWWIPALGKSVGTLLYLHGNGINIGANVEHALRFHQLGFSVLLIDYRGYGRSVSVFPSEASVYADAQRAWNYLVQERRIPPAQIYIYGHSLGGAIAIELATRQPQAAAVIVESSFTSIRALTDLKGWPRFFPVDVILTQRFDSLRKVQSLKLLSLFIHGTADTLIPFEMSQSLYAAAPQPKQLILVPQAGHGNVASVAGPAYLQAVQALVQQRLSLSHRQS